MFRLANIKLLSSCALVLLCASVSQGQAKEEPAASTDQPVLSESEIVRIRAYYDSADQRTRAELSAYYEDLDIDIEEILGISSEQKAQQKLAQQIVSSLSKLSLSRTPGEVLSERTAMTIQGTMPNLSVSSGNDIASWIRRVAVAGEWEHIAVLLGQLPETSARGVSIQLFDTLAGADHQLLPEEVLRVAMVLPGDLDAIHIAPLGRMLSDATKRHGTATLLDELRQGNRQFNLHDPVARRNSALLLLAANLHREAYEFLPPLDDARSNQDADVMHSHGVYLAELASTLADGPEADTLRRRAFAIFAEVAALPTASPKHIRRAIERNANLLHRLPRPITDPWLKELFADPISTQIATEVFALRATKIAKSKNAQERSETLVSLSRAVEIMLQSGKRDTLRVPLRVLAGVISQEIENMQEAVFDKNWLMNNLLRLMRAAPSPTWLAAIDTSAATRASRALIGASIITGDTDRAIAALRAGIERSPGDAQDLAQEFLVTWERYLKSQLSKTRDSWSWDYSNVLTRGQQRRRLAALREVMDILQELGVDTAGLSTTADLFAASHQGDEVYRLSDIETVFGPIEAIPPLTACDLAERMRSRILNYWNERIRPPKDGRPKTPTAEITRVVNTGYDTALELLTAAEYQSPDLWNIHAVRASVSYDRLQLNKRLGQIKQGRELELTSLAFAAFERAAKSYADAINRGENIESSDIYARWFRASLGASDVSALSAETLPSEDSLGDNQFGRIRAAMQSLPGDAAYRHAEEFIAEIMEAYNGAPPEVKPRLARSALRVVTDHPSAGPLRESVRFHEEVASHEIKLRLIIDGSHEVQEDRPLMALLAVRFTNAVNRSSGGFTQYLSNGRRTSYRDDLEKAIRQAFSKGFEVTALNLFEANTSVPHGVIEDGEDGWLELPLAILYVQPNDPSIDHLPQIEMQVYVQDNNGSVAIVLQSNTPPIKVVPSAPLRLVQELEVTQTLDTRNTNDSERPEITLDIRAQGRGTIPVLDDLLEGLSTAAPGFKLVEDDIEARSTLFIGEKTIPLNAPPGFTNPTPELDELGVLRPRVERSWLLRYIPTSQSPTGVFTLPTLGDGVTANLVSQSFGDTDLEPILGATIRYDMGVRWGMLMLIVAMLILLVVGIFFLRRKVRKQVRVVVDERTPIRRSPSGAVLALRAMHQEAAKRSDFQVQHDLEQDIAAIERDFFRQSPDENAHKNLDRIVTRWSKKYAAAST